jgi:hypothetical protein
MSSTPHSVPCSLERVDTTHSLVLSCPPTCSRSRARAHTHTHTHIHTHSLTYTHTHTHTPAHTLMNTRTHLPPHSHIRPIALILAEPARGRWLLLLAMRKHKRCQPSPDALAITQAPIIHTHTGLLVLKLDRFLITHSPTCPLSPTSDGTRLSSRSPQLEAFSLQCFFRCCCSRPH